MDAAARAATAAAAAAAAQRLPPVLDGRPMLADAWPPVMARFPDPLQAQARWGLASLAPGRSTPTTQAELDGWLADTPGLAAPGTQVSLTVIGRSQLGLPMQALRLSRGPGRPLVLLLGQQHGNEPAGAEALMVLARELAHGALGPVLDQLDVLLVPRLNVDGAAWASRLSSNGLDINRDHLLLRTPEARALAALVRQQRPVLVVDCHEYAAAGRMLRKFGALPRHDLLLQYAMAANLPSALGEASEAWFVRPVQAALAAAGHTSAWYHTNGPAPDDLTLRMGGPEADTVRNAYGLRHVVSLLLESRGIGLGNLHLARRVQSQLLALRTVLQQAALHAPALLALQVRADAEVRAQACTGLAVLEAGMTLQRRDWPMIDPLSGADRWVAVGWASALNLVPLRQRARPCGYWLAADQQRAAARLLMLGVQVQRLLAPTTLRSEAWVALARGESDLSAMLADDDAPPEPADPAVAGAMDGQARAAGLRRLTYIVELRAETLQAPAGSFYVPMDQASANLVLAALEPDTPTSFVAHGVISHLDGARRVLARPGALD